MKNAAKFFTGSVATYVLMAACSAASSGPSASSAAGADQISAIGGATGSSGASTADLSGGKEPAHAGSSGMLGMMMDPVPDASAEPATDGTRLKAVYLVGADGARQWNFIWWDSERDEECSFATFTDGMSRCVPAAIGVASAFSDAGCTSPLFMVVAGSCATPAAKYALVLGPLTCGTYSYQAVDVLTPTVPDKVYSGTPSACVDETVAFKPAYSFYTGSPITLSSFVTATKQHG